MQVLKQQLVVSQETYYTLYGGLLQDAAKAEYLLKYLLSSALDDSSSIAERTYWQYELPFDDTDRDILKKAKDSFQKAETAADEWQSTLGELSGQICPGSDRC